MAGPAGPATGKAVLTIREMALRERISNWHQQSQ